jgi:hypothetical protein
MTLPSSSELETMSITTNTEASLSWNYEGMIQRLDLGGFNHLLVT